VQAHRVVRGRGSHIFWTIDSQMAVRLPALSAGRPLSPGRFLVLFSVWNRVDPRAIMRLEVLDQLKKKSNYLNGTRTRYFTACNIVPQATTLPRAPRILHTLKILIYNLPSWNGSVNLIFERRKPVGIPVLTYVLYYIYIYIWKNVITCLFLYFKP
jgi:hypothetical protein